MNGTNASNALINISMEILQICMWTKIKRAKKLHPMVPNLTFINLTEETTKNKTWFRDIWYKLTQKKRDI